MMKVLLVLSALVACVIAVPDWNAGNPCGVSKYANAGTMPLPGSPAYSIVGGAATQPNEYPWTASIRRKATNGHFCGGFIINRNWVMTAAHCMSGETAAVVSVVVGDHTRNEASTIRQTKDINLIVMHENYNSRTYVNDIALVRVSTPIDFTENVQPICAPDNTKNYEHQYSVVCGWGTLSSGGACCPQTLQHVSVNITTNVYCNSAYPLQQVTADMICATDNTGSRERDSCQGDSGGPLMVKENGIFSIVGIVSWGIGCASGYPGVYARVSHFENWILSKIN